MLSLCYSTFSLGPYLDASDDADDDKPEPEEDVDLLIDDVEREDAKTVKVFDSP